MLGCANTGVSYSGSTRALGARSPSSILGTPKEYSSGCPVDCRGPEGTRPSLILGGPKKKGLFDKDIQVALDESGELVL